jgi:hypothetical protein
MPAPIDILRLLPELASIGRAQLQTYCNEWLQRPIAREFGITHLIVGGDILLTVNIDDKRARFVEGHAFVPLDELVGYIIDQHFTEPAKRQELHGRLLALRKHWNETGKEYQVMAGRVGYLWLKCKNPNCDLLRESGQQAVEGQRVHCPRSRLTCPECGHTDTYDGSDLFLRF